MLLRYLPAVFVTLLFAAGCATSPSPDLNEKLDRSYQQAKKRLEDSRTMNTHRLRSDTYTRAEKLLNSTRTAQRENPSPDQLEQYRYVENLAHSAMVASIQEALQRKQQRIEKLNRTVQTLEEKHEKMDPAGGIDLKKIRKKLEEQSKRIDRLKKTISQTSKNVQSLSGRLEAQQETISKLRTKIEKGEQQLEELAKENKKIRTLTINQIEGSFVEENKGRVTVRLPAGVMFEDDSADLTSLALSRLREAAKIIKQFPDRPVRVEGHVKAEEAGTTQYTDDWEFASRRSVSALKYLVYGRAVQKTRIAAVSFGSLMPLPEDASGASELTDGRLEITFLPPRDVVYVDQPSTEKQTRRNLAKRFREFLDERDVQQKHGRVAVNLSDKITFEPASATLKPNAKTVLDRFGRILENARNYPIRVQGHTDDLPPAPGSSYPSNWELSAARAISVLKYLRGNYELSGRDMGAVAMGQFYPLESNTSEANRARNRRVEIHLLPRALSP